MKKIKNIFIILSLLLIMTGCGNPKNKALKSVEYLENISYYSVYLHFTNSDDSEYYYDFTFDDNSQITTRDISINEIPKTSEYIKFDNNKIIRYYGDMYKHEELENSYYLNKWNKEELLLNDENKEKYTFLDKNFYVEMIENGLEYKKDGIGYWVVVPKEYIQKIVDQLHVKDYQVEKDVEVKITYENNNLSMMQILHELDGFKNIAIMFQTDFDEDSDKYLELPEV